MHFDYSAAGFFQCLGEDDRTGMLAVPLGPMVFEDDVLIGIFDDFIDRMGQVDRACVSAAGGFYHAESFPCFPRRRRIEEVGVFVDVNDGIDGGAVLVEVPVEDAFGGWEFGSGVVGGRGCGVLRIEFIAIELDEVIGSQSALGGKLRGGDQHTALGV